VAAPIAQFGRSPGLMWLTRRGNVLAAGQVRRLWRQLVNLIEPQAPYSWTHSAPNPDRAEFSSGHAVGITRALRYRTLSLYMGAGHDNTRLTGLHSTVLPHQRRSPQARGKRVTVAAGSVRGRPTVRNRMTSFGSRVPTLNEPSPAADTEESNG
jgi:hypothetical protein